MEKPSQKPAKAPSASGAWRLRSVDFWLARLLALARRSPLGRIGSRGLRVQRDLAYLPSGSQDHRLDLYVPPGPGPHPVVFYAHGGGFSILSKDTHWLMAAALAQRGFLVVNINYRLAPRAPFPAALEDATQALLWTWKHIEAHGGDRSRLMLAGESAGANLVTCLALALSYRRPEAYAQALFESGIQVQGVAPACGILDVTDPGRFRRRKARLPRPIDRRIHMVSRHYLGANTPEQAALASPLLLLEAASAPSRPLPPFFITVGTRDPILDDSRRLKAALDKLQVPAEIAYYEGGVHAFHALIWQERAQTCWNDTARFLRAQGTLPQSKAGFSPT